MLHVVNVSAECSDTTIVMQLDFAAVLNRNKQISRSAVGLELRIRRQSSRTIKHSELSV